MRDRAQLFGITFDRVRMAEATRRILDWCTEPPAGNGCRMVVTPNVDHAVQFQQREGLRTAYGSAALMLVDGAPIVWASRLLGRPLPERVAGSDLVPALFDAARPLRIFLLGAAPGVAARAAARVAAAWPHVSVVGTDSPPLGFEDDLAENERIVHKIADAAPDLLIVGLGAPKQEIWTHQHLGRIRAKVAICAGATIDFLAGEKRRSPPWMRRIGLEWLYRVSREPRRLARRYARDARIFPQLVWREWLAGRQE